ncbi:uncharacterized protein LOC113516836 [Galleria mellonella]|uniref:Uncharacterized protein LOC113516836 n=1 Tax=Galleria mellonella TaxID=7137 RepID=A0A6J1WPB6_GALME|nr:uncharacterized protein LOC113516836 [Galleria mellonella]XP_052758673.1 uncharacterized protein LOC113516836 [Galleria mellonella]
MGPLTKNSGSRARSVPVRFKYLFLLATICGSCFLILSISNNTTMFFPNSDNLITSSSFDVHRVNAGHSDKSYTIKTEGCTIPGLKPFHESIRKFIRQPEPNTCPNANTSLLENNNTHIWIKEENLHFYNMARDFNISCCYQTFYRPTAVADITAMNVDDRVQYEPCINFTSYIEVMNEFVKVSCGYDYKTLYVHFFLFAPKKPMLTYDEESFEMPLNQTAYNVIVMGLDAISRLNFHRTMPKTLAFLKKKGAIELLGYNKVGDNTFPNLTPMLLGIREKDLKKTCWPHIRSTFDNCPFIWEFYKDAGYYTALGEDSAKLGTFNFGKFGFIGTPTDYYIHTFMHEAETHIGNKKDYNTFICMGNQHFYKVLLDYIEALTTTLKSSKLFGFFWEVTLSHDYLNYPMLMDSSYEKFLKNLDESQYLDDTILILLSDHGIRWGDIRYTKQGRLEERLPFVHILVPPTFEENYNRAYNNLRLNSRRLTTPFDIHATLSDLINLDSLTDEKITSRSEMPYAHDRSISLFLPLPKNRTCKIAGIDDHWCTCHKSNKLTTDSAEAQEAAAQLVRSLNLMMHEYPQCSRLTLAEVIETTEMIVGTPPENEDGWREIMIVVRTAPGGGVFEATLQHDSRQWTLVGTVSRLNLYGDQSRCVHHYQLKLYCYCY